MFDTSELTGSPGPTRGNALACPSRTDDAAKERKTIFTTNEVNEDTGIHTMPTDAGQLGAW